MSTFSVSPVVKEAGPDLGAGDPGQFGPAGIYTVVGTNQERIESVNVIITYDAHVLSQDFYVLRIVSPAGLTVFTQATPNFKWPDSTDGPARYELTWARGTTGNAQAAPFLTDPDLSGNPLLAYWTGPLPDVVLDANSTVTLERDVQLEGGSLTVTITDLTVTVTRNIEADGDVATTDETPLWLPIPPGGPDT